MILRVRLDALRKNLQQIMGMRDAILERRKEVEDLHRLARDQTSGIGWRLKALERQIDMALDTIKELQEADIAAARLEAPKSALESAMQESAQILEGFPRMEGIIGQMAERWDQIANERIPAELGNEAETRDTKIAEWQTSLQGPSPPSASSPGAASPGEIWDEYEWMAFGKGESLFGEYVDIIGGLALRNTGVDAGVCQMADDLLHCLSGAWRSRGSGSLAVPTRKMAPMESMGQIVRLGFPEWTVWAVPVAAHEFGHVALAGDSALMDRAETELEIPRPLLDTYVADAFGAAALGPAYASALVLLALDPCRADKEERAQAPTSEPERTRTLSPDSGRFHVVREILEVMDEGNGTVSAVGETLREAWGSALDAFGLSIESAWEESLRGCAHFVWRHLYETAPQLRYRASQFSAVSEWDGLGDHEPGVFPSAIDDVRDILNAAWQQRLASLAQDQDHDPVELAHDARKLWRERFGRGTRPRGEFSTDVRGP